MNTKPYQLIQTHTPNTSSSLTLVASPSQLERLFPHISATIVGRRLLCPWVRSSLRSRFLAYAIFLN
ncbi:uncharacterized protein G2W53_027702 [Senna tora]|uniref:Uncharacterized protein n=1 Tax=Senna tora TaxID=362788 RepID=A0A834WGV0_9FABA|nr:uncharacterized protein G2W53_027702 [Senna tora]